MDLCRRHCGKALWTLLWLALNAATAYTVHWYMQDAVRAANATALTIEVERDGLAELFTKSVSPSAHDGEYKIALRSPTLAGLYADAKRIRDAIAVDLRNQGKGTP